jgi:hypothetical protein
MKSKGEEPLITLPVNGKYLLGVYQGSLSEFDLLLKYRHRGEDGSWSRIRTPKHIHWAVDLLIKLYTDEGAATDFLDFLIGYWNNVEPLRSEADRAHLLNTEVLLAEVNEEAARYEDLSAKGEYSAKFLILVAKLLMVQEKTNRTDAYMFGQVLEALRDGRDIFGIVSAATYSGR